MILHRARFDELDGAAVYALLRLRSDVFVVEQQCPYPELDGRDVEPGARHLWLAPPEDRLDPLAYLRILDEAGGELRIGRVCTAQQARGAGLSGRLMAGVVEGETRPCVLDAQSYLTGFYERYGFVATGPEFVEDGIPHIPMRRG